MTELDTAQVLERARAVVRREARAVEALAGQFDESLVEIVRVLLECKGHVLVTGAGTSHTTAERFAHLLSCCGTPALGVSAADALHGGAGAITPNDIVFMISKGGHSAEIDQFAAIARRRGARIIAQTENPDSPLGRAADYIYKVVAPAEADPFGYIATGSSLVNGAAGDALCVLLLEISGYSLEEFGRTHPSGDVGRKLAGG